MVQRNLHCAAQRCTLFILDLMCALTSSTAVKFLFQAVIITWHP